MAPGGAQQRSTPAISDLCPVELCVYGLDYSSII